MRYVDIDDLKDLIKDPTIKIESKDDVLLLLEELENSERGRVVLGPSSSH